MALSDLLQRIKAALGIGSSRGARQEQPAHQSGRTQRPSDHPPEQGSSVDVTVEREPATESEDAVKGTETAGTAPGSDADATGQPVSDTGQDTEPEADPEPEADAEPEADESEESDAAEESDEGEESNESDESAGTEEPVDVIKGIGPTYADRLGEAGVETVADLAASDLEALAEESGVSEGRLENWIEKAKHR